MTWEYVNPLFKLLMITGSLVSVIISALGVWLVYLGATGNTEFALVGQSFKSANVGIAAIFLGAVVAIVVIRAYTRLISQTLRARPRSVHRKHL